MSAPDGVPRFLWPMSAVQASNKKIVNMTFGPKQLSKHDDQWR